MQLVAVSVVKNEADVIEAFVRHHRAWVDHHLVFDHDSTDGTREILGNLVREGFPLSVFTDDSLGNLQQSRSHQLTRLAAAELGADWVLPLDADEFLAGPNRSDLEKCLEAMARTGSASLLLLNFCPTAADDVTELNPVIRLRYCEPAPGPTRKIMVPRILALDPGVAAGKGSHALRRGPQQLPDSPLPDRFHLAHFPERSASQVALRIVLAELQKLSRGRAAAGIDLHYRLAFQTLAENPEVFFATLPRPVHQLRLAPLDYAGGPLRHAEAVPAWSRPARALLPFLEKLAVSHGRLLDQMDRTGPEGPAGGPVRRLEPDELTATTFAGREDAFTGFHPREGWGPAEGPVTDAFLPVFHWGLAPGTLLSVTVPKERMARLAVEALTYSDGQKVLVELNGTALHEHGFGRVRQRERIVCSLPLLAGENQLMLRYATSLQTTLDSRKLAVIFLSLRIV